MFVPYLILLLYSSHLSTGKTCHFVMSFIFHQLERYVIHIASFISHLQKHTIKIMSYTSTGETCHFLYFIHFNNVTYLLGRLTVIPNVLGYTM
jgi:hypothetical protein